MKLPLDFESYPNLEKLYHTDKQKFGSLVRGILQYLDQSVEKEYPEVTEKIFRTDYISFLDSITEAFFDYEGILSNHPNKAETDFLKALKHENNPLAVLAGASPAYDRNGNRIPPEEWTPYTNIKDFLQSLLYGARYVPLAELAAYLNLGKFDLIDELKGKHHDKLLPIQPALEWQKDSGILIGKLIPGTGFFDGGELDKGRSTRSCPCCGADRTVQKTGNILGCFICKIGFTTTDEV